MASSTTIERSSRSLIDALRYNYPRSPPTMKKPVQRRDSKVTAELKYQVRVHWPDHGVYVFDLKNTMLVADLKAMIQTTTGVPVVGQRLTLNDEVLESDKTFHESGFDDGMLRPSALWTQIELTPLSGLCLPDADMDFWVKTSGSVSQQLVPVHARRTTPLRDLGMLLFERHGNLPRGQRQLVCGQHVVYDSRRDVTRPEQGGPDTPRTLGDLDVEQGAVLEVQMVILPT